MSNYFADVPARIRNLIEGGQLDQALSESDLHLLTATGVERVQVLCLKSLVLVTRTDALTAMRLGNEALTEAKAQGNAGAECEALLAIGYSLQGLEHHARAIEAFQDAERLAIRADDSAMVARARRRIGVSLSVLGRHAQAVAMLDDAVRALKVHGDNTDACHAEYSLITAQSRALDSAAATGGVDSRAYAQLMNQWRGFADAMRVHGFRRLESMAIGNAGIAAQRAGALEEALEWLERADRMHDECQQTSHRAITQSHIGEVYLALGNRAAGIAAIEQSILLLGQGRPRDRMEAWDALAVAHEAHGDAKQALAALKEARSIERQLHDEEAHIAAAKREQREEFSRIVEEWSRVADQDALSGLPNRRAFDRRMAEMLSVASAAAPCSLILFDLDHFKRINDTYGHATGDAVIKRFAQLLAADRRNGDLPARIGGEEFALLLDATPVEAHRVAERIRACVESEPWSIVQAGLNVTVSAGVVCSLQATSPAQAFERADQCLYRAKHGGRNRVFVEGGDDGVTPIL